MFLLTEISHKGTNYRIIQTWNYSSNSNIYLIESISNDGVYSLSNEYDDYFTAFQSIFINN